MLHQITNWKGVQNKTNIKTNPQLTCSRFNCRLHVVLKQRNQVIWWSLWVCKKHQDPKSRSCSNPNQCPTWHQQSWQLKAKLQFCSNKNISTERQTLTTATPQTIRSYIPPPGELERPGTPTLDLTTSPLRFGGRMNENPDKTQLFKYLRWEVTQYYIIITGSSSNSRI